MPFRAWVNGQDTDADEVPPEQWSALKKLKDKQVRLPCCDGHGYMAGGQGTSKQQYFGHMRKGECAHADESAEHRYLKKLIKSVCDEHGWQARYEEIGEDYRADVMARKDGKQKAFEVQLSKQTYEETARRTAVYIGHGIQALWLFKRDISRWQSSLDEDGIQAYLIPVQEVEVRALIARLLDTEPIEAEEEDEPEPTAYAPSVPKKERRELYSYAAPKQLAEGFFAIVKCPRCQKRIQVLVGKQVIEDYRIRIAPAWYASQIVPLYRLLKRPGVGLMESNCHCPYCNHYIAGEVAIPEPGTSLIHFKG